MATKRGGGGVGVKYGADPARELEGLSPRVGADSVKTLHQWLMEHA